jgi:hypothetical protein
LRLKIIFMSLELGAPRPVQTFENLVFKEHNVKLHHSIV